MASFLGCALLMSAAAWADVVKSCSGTLEVWLSYQPKGQENVIRKTDMVRISELMIREGRYGGADTVVGRQKARRRACERVAKDMAREYNRNTAKQLEAICGGKRSYRNPDRDSKFLDSDWIKIDKAEVRGWTDSATVKYKADIEAARVRFKCKGGKPEIVNAASATGQRPASAPPSPPPPPPSGPKNFIKADSDRPGGTYRSITLAAGDMGSCKRLCDEDVKCKAWVYAKPGSKGDNKVRCYLKDKVTPLRDDACCVSGIK